MRYAKIKTSGSQIHHCKKNAISISIIAIIVAQNASVSKRYRLTRVPRPAASPLLVGKPTLRERYLSAASSVAAAAAASASVMSPNSPTMRSGLDVSSRASCWMSSSVMLFIISGAAFKSTISPVAK